MLYNHNEIKNNYKSTYIIKKTLEINIQEFKLLSYYLQQQIHQKLKDMLISQKNIDVLTIKDLGINL